MASIKKTTPQNWDISTFQQMESTKEELVDVRRNIFLRENSLLNVVTTSEVNNIGECINEHDYSHWTDS